MFNQFDGYSDNEREPGREPEFPGLTKWENKCSCCCFQLDKITTNNVTYINGWEIKLCPVTLIIFLSILSISTYIFMFRPRLLISKTFCDVVFFIFEFLFVYSYLITICEGPGFLPFYYPLQIGNSDNKFTDYLSGTVSTFSQAEYVKSQPKLRRTRYFSSVKRYVVRPDHYCYWTQQFIGKKNMKTFMLFNVYGIIFVTINFLLALFHLVFLVLESKFTVFDALYMMSYMVVSCFLIGLTGTFAYKSIKNINSNITHFEKIHPEDYSFYEEECCKNWADVFGPRSQFLYWPMPIPAFHNVDTRELAAIYL